MNDYINKLWSRIQAIFMKGKATVIDNSGPVQLMQISLNTNQVRSDVFAPQQYGIETAPHAGADVVAMFKGGDVENGYVTKAFEPKHKPTDIEEGDTYLYTGRNTEETKVHRIWLKEEDGKILIETDAEVQVICNDLDAQVANTATVDVGVLATVTCPSTVWTGNITLLGNLIHTGNYTQVGDYNLTGTGTATVDFVSAGKSGANHTHTGNLGAPTSPPL